ncbi:MAG: hypothetical protein WCI97_12020 [Bacteroidota bacterium]
MSLYEKLQKATSEEDVKDIFIKALGLKNYQKNLYALQIEVESPQQQCPEAVREDLERKV